jgi:hypothetical protein
MYCPQCGVALPVPAPRFCPSCGADLAPGAPLTAIARPGVVTFLAVLQFLGGAVNALGGVLLVALAAWADDRSMQSVLGLVGAGVLAIAAVQFVCGTGLWKLKPYGRTIQIVLASIGLVGFPIGTVIGVLMLVYLMKPGVKLLFSGRPPAGFSADEQRQIGELYGSRGLVIVAVAVAAGFAIVFLGAIVAAIAIPGLLRARMVGNETRAILLLRQLQSAEVAYAAQTGGAYDAPACLVAPADCIPGFAGDPLVDRSPFESASAAGYDLRFEPGPAAASVASGGTVTISSTGVASYAFVAEPQRFGSTGTRSFCADSTGRVCAVPRITIDAAGAQCPLDCIAVQ